MATRPSLSRDSSVTRPSLPQRPSLSRLSNPDVFSDDFAVSSRGHSPVDSIDSSLEDLPVHATSPPPPPRISTAIPSSHLNTPNFSRPSSTSKRPLAFGDTSSGFPHRAVSSISHSDAGVYRSSSVASQFSMPRAQSPYTGPTAPSQPYAMYPQVTRASSIASESTIRPTERPYVSTGGPQHPYGMYPQNTVDEEDNTDDSQELPSVIPLGFPGMGQDYRSNQASTLEMGDIVGSDGHIEQLPPYTRYADNTIAKAASEDVPAPVAPVDISLSPSSEHSSAGDLAVNLNTAAARNAGVPEADHDEKSCATRRLRRKVCWGISLCVWLLVVGVVVVAATLGGVIGGVIGNDRASESAADYTPTATTTVWLDAAPLPTNVPSPDCTPGVYNIPTSNYSLDTSACIQNPQYSDAWACLEAEAVPFYIKYAPHGPIISIGKPGPGRTGESFNYGAQVPDLNDSFHRLTPAIDKDDPNAGGAMYLDVLYNKLTVVPAAAFPHPYSKRTVNFAELEARSLATVPVAQDDMPFFCWFNQTLLEFFIYSNVSTAAGAANSTAYAYATSTTATPGPWPLGSPASTSTTTSSSMAMNQVYWPTTTPPPPPPYGDTSDGVWTTTTTADWPPEKRHVERSSGTSNDGNFPIYPKQIRLAEKRAPSGQNVSPYCVQVRIESDWSVCPIEGTEFQITEVEPVVQSSRRKWNRPRQSNNNNLDSDCACQWYST